MSIMNTEITPSPLVLHTGPGVAGMTHDQFFDFCELNPDLRIERSAEGDLIIMTPSGMDSSRQNAELVWQLTNWSKQDGTGLVFDSSAGVWLPNGAMRSPDAMWIRRDRWDSLEDRQKFGHLAPDFVAEIRSATDRLSYLRAKLQEFVDNGVRLGWLIDPLERRVEAYRPDQEPVMFENPASVSGDPELAGFVLDLAPIW